jgi:pre-rRNA-processing protein TSR4
VKASPFPPESVRAQYLVKCIQQQLVSNIFICKFKMADEDFDNDINGSEEGEIDTGVQLGFITDGENAMFSDQNWGHWDGGRVGGKPIWLNPLKIPAPTNVACKCCRSPMIFLLQIYCPLDDNDDAFHRSLYVFICKKKKCVDGGSVKCFRCQLSRKNDFYPFSPIKEHESNVNPSSIAIPPLCALCGFKAPNVCSKCKVVTYCSREHQQRHWRDHKQHCCSDSANSELAHIENKTNASSSNTLTFPEFDLSISAEILIDIEKIDALNESVLQASIWENASAVEVDDGSDDEDEKNDADLTQTDYNTALGNEASDNVYTKFMERVRRGGGNQVLRYIRWDDIEGPLSLSSSDVTTNPRGTRREPTPLEIEPEAESGNFCLHCGAIKKFEFQIMPQLLHFLRVDKRTKIASNDNSNNNNKSVDKLSPKLEAIQEELEGTEIESGVSEEAGGGVKGETEIEQKLKVIEEEEAFLLENKTDEDIDWGTIDIYTCSASCSASANGISAYIEESTYVQRPLSFFRSTSKEPEISEKNK